MIRKAFTEVIRSTTIFAYLPPAPLLQAALTFNMVKYYTLFNNSQDVIEVSSRYDQKT